jgi:CO/xanthine dehydrogenase Mo-binding subunit
MTTTTTTGGQVGRSLPRLEAREKVTGRAEYTHTMRLPGMLHGKVFRSTVAHGRIKSIDVSAARKVPGVYRVVTSEDVRKVIPTPITARPSTTSRSSPSARCTMWASRSRWCSPPIRMSPRRRRS